MKAIERQNDKNINFEGRDWENPTSFWVKKLEQGNSEKGRVEGGGENQPPFTCQQQRK